jgi:hypothetical protein
MSTTDQSRPDGGLEILSEQTCRELLASRDLGRIAFAMGKDTEIFPVNYSTDGTIVVFRTGAGTKLTQSTVTRVAFEVDEWNAANKVGWSVVLKGVAQEVTTGTDPFSTTLRTRPVVPLAPGEHDYWIAIYPATISGRRFRADQT